MIQLDVVIPVKCRKERDRNRNQIKQDEVDILERLFSLSHAFDSSFCGETAAFSEAAGIAANIAAQNGL